MKKVNQSPGAFSYLSYREFLRDRLEWQNSQKKLSARAFATLAGFGSPSFFKMILDGKRKLTQKNLEGLAKALELSKSEVKYLNILVEFEHASGLEEKNKLYAQLLQFKKFSEARHLERDQFEYFSNWYNVVILEALGTLHWTQKHAVDFAKKLKITVKQVEEALALLARLKLIEKFGNRYRPTQTNLETAPEIQSLMIRNYHRQMIAKAQSAVEQTPQHKRDLGALTLSLSEEKYQDFKKRLFAFRSEMNAIFSNDEKAKKVYQLNFQLFPLLEDEEPNSNSEEIFSHE